MNLAFCRQSKVCTSCDLIKHSYEEQTKFKLNHWQQLLKDSQFLVHEDPQYIGEENPHRRCKLDFTIDGPARGLYSQLTKNIVDLPSCELLSPELFEFYTEFRQIQFALRNKASFRLRLGPQKQKGIWLDFSHEDINTFLDHPSCQEVLNLGFVEVGQKLKKLFCQNKDRGILVKPELQPWFETFYNNQWVPLYSYVGSFTQPSFVSHRWMINQLKIWLDEIKPKSAFEYGCGVGNWSLFLLNYVDNLSITESDRNSLSALEKNLETHQLKNKVRILSSGFQQHKQNINEQYDLIFLNPSRSGVGALTESIKNKSKYIIYISCFPESLIKDMSVLKSTYRLKSHTIVDQFPASSHFEVLSVWERIA